MTVMDYGESSYKGLELHYKPVEFDGFMKEVGLNSFTLTSKQWIEKTIFLTRL